MSIQSDHLHETTQFVTGLVLEVEDVVEATVVSLRVDDSVSVGVGTIVIRLVGFSEAVVEDFVVVVCTIVVFSDVVRGVVGFSGVVGGVVGSGVFTVVF